MTTAAEEQKRPRNPLVWVLGLSLGFFFLFLMLSGVFYFLKPIGKGTPKVASSFFGQGVVAVVEINGVILDSKKILKTLDRLAETEDVRSVVIRINSPGGAVAPSQEIYRALREYKKPIVASLSSVSASGGYYIACGTQRIFSNPGTLTGSIGVIMQFANLEKLYEWAKIKRFAIKTGKFKDAGAEYRDMTAEERRLLQVMVDDVLSQFKKAVAEGRGLSLAQVTEVADGRLLTGAQAKKLKLVDELGGLQEAIAEAGKLGGIKGKPEVFYPERRRFRLMNILFDDPGQEDEVETAVLTSPLSWIDFFSKRFFGKTQVQSLSPGLYLLWSGGYTI